MTSPIEQSDRWVYSVEVTTDNRTVKVQEDDDGDGITDTTFSANLSTGTYWGYHDRLAGSPSGYPGILSAIQSAMNSASPNNTYELRAEYPDNDSTVSNGQTGLRIEATNSSPVEFQLEFDSSTIPSEWVGWGDGTVLTQTSATNTPDAEIVSPISIFGCWRPVTAFSDNTASRKSKDEKRWLDTSSDDQVNAVQIEYGDPTVTDEIMYPEMPAAVVRESRAEDIDYSDAAGLVADDVNAALYWLWQQASKGDKTEVIVVHNDPADTHTIDTVSDDVEIGYLDVEQRKRFSSLWEKSREQGEFFDVTIKIVALERKVSF
jgi:hypothetical protein